MNQVYRRAVCVVPVAHRRSFLSFSIPFPSLSLPFPFLFHPYSVPFPLSASDLHFSISYLRTSLLSFIFPSFSSFSHLHPYYHPSLFFFLVYPLFLPPAFFPRAVLFLFLFVVASSPASFCPPIPFRFFRHPIILQLLLLSLVLSSPIRTPSRL